MLKSENEKEKLSNQGKNSCDVTNDNDYTILNDIQWLAFHVHTNKHTNYIILNSIMSSMSFIGDKWHRDRKLFNQNFKKQKTESNKKSFFGLKKICK